MLIRIAREQGGIEGFRADVLLDNKSMLRVFEKTPFPLRAIVSEGTYEIVISFAERRCHGRDSEENWRRRS